VHLSDIAVRKAFLAFYLQEGGRKPRAQIWNKFTSLSPYVYDHSSANLTALNKQKMCMQNVTKSRHISKMQVYTDYDTIPYDTIRDAILTCARKPTWVRLIYRTEPTTKECKNRKKLKVENRYAQKYYYYYSRLTASFPGQPGFSLDLNETRDEISGCSGISMQTTCILLQADNHTNTSPLNF